MTKKKLNIPNLLEFGNTLPSCMSFSLSMTFSLGEATICIITYRFILHSGFIIIFRGNRLLCP